jgi:hypothetical protein
VSEGVTVTGGVSVTVTDGVRVTVSDDVGVMVGVSVGVLPRTMVGVEVSVPAGVSVAVSVKVSRGNRPSGSWICSCAVWGAALARAVSKSERLMTKGRRRDARTKREKVTGYPRRQG